MILKISNKKKEHDCSLYSEFNQSSNVKSSDRRKLDPFSSVQLKKGIKKALFQLLIYFITIKNSCKVFFVTIHSQNESTEKID